jgi:hypothetical protein
MRQGGILATFFGVHYFFGLKRKSIPVLWILGICSHPGSQISDPNQKVAMNFTKMKRIEFFEPVQKNI